MSAGATATGTRSYIAARHFSWVTPRRMKRITIGLIALALGASSLVFSGSGPPSDPRPATPAAVTPSG